MTFISNATGKLEPMDLNSAKTAEPSPFTLAPELESNQLFDTPTENKSTGAVAEKPKPLASTPTNTKGRSQAPVTAKPEPGLFLDTATGDIILVPAEDITEFRNEFRSLSYVMADFQAANAEVASLEQETEKLLATCKTDLITKLQLEQLSQKLDAAITWQEEAHGALQEKIKHLGKTTGSGKKLVELIPLLADGKVVSGKATETKQNASASKVSYEKKANGAIGINDKVYHLPEKLVYARSDKFKPKWPKYKDDATPVKWAEVLRKDEHGKRKIDKQKLKTFAQEKLKKIKVDSSDFVKLEFETAGGITDWADAWNKSGKGRWSQQGKVQVGDFTGDIDLSTEAQLMRYMLGGSLNATFEPFKRGVSVKAEGSAECALAEAKASAQLHYPSRDGWMWSFKDAGGKEHDLGAVRCVLSIELSGVVGASIAGELSLSVQTREIEGMLPGVKGRSVKNKRGKRKKVAVNETIVEDGIATELEVFAGAQASADLKGSVQWRNPESKDKGFLSFAHITAAPTAQVGFAAGFNCTVQYLPANGTFRIVAGASLCLGVGAEGKVGAEVSVKTIGEFIKWTFYQLYHCDFRTLKMLTEDAFKAIVRLQFYVIAKGLDIATHGLISEREINLLIDSIEKSFTNKATSSQARRDLAKKILTEPQALRHAVPEAKGQLLYQLTRFNIVDGAMTGLGQSYLADQKAAVLLILKWSHTKRDLENVIQHMSPKGKKHKNMEIPMSELRAFLATEGPSGINIPGINATWDEDFDSFYNKLHASLMSEPTRGFAVNRSDSMAYTLAKNEHDHPLFASTGPSAYYKQIG